jgi:hypothetical protein
MKLIANDVKKRVQLALEAGETGDWEVIEHLAINDLVTQWTRKDSDGKIRRFSNRVIKAGVQELFEVRPDEPLKAKTGS